jgi:hypothetical protein
MSLKSRKNVLSSHTVELAAEYGEASKVFSLNAIHFVFPTSLPSYTA